MKSMDKISTGIAYGTSAGSAGYWFLQLLDKVTPSQWAAIGKSAASRKGSGEAQCCGGFIPGGIGCWREKTPARCRYIPDNITGANLEPRPLKNSRETLSLQHRRLYDARRAGHGLLA